MKQHAKRTGDYKVSVKASDHKNSTGKNYVHLYYIQNDGSRIGVGGTTTKLSSKCLDQDASFY